MIAIYLVGFKNLNQTEDNEINSLYWILGILVSFLLSTIASLIYFKGKGIKPTLEEGSRLGLTYLIVFIALDLLIITPLILTNTYAEIFGAYYRDPFFLISAILIILTPAFIGALKEKLDG